MAAAVAVTEAAAVAVAVAVAVEEGWGEQEEQDEEAMGAMSTGEEEAWRETCDVLLMASRQKLLMIKKRKMWEQSQQ